jgi:hypothetical protein
VRAPSSCANEMIASRENPDHVSEFDVSEAILALRSDLRNLALFNSAGAGMGLGAVGLGLALVAKHPTLNNPTLLVGGIIVALAGALVSGLYLPTVLRYIRKPRRIAVSKSGLTLSFQGRTPRRNYLWNDPRVEMTVFDRRGLGPKLPTGEPTSFSVNLKGAPPVPITQAAFEGILDSAKSAGARVTHRTVEPGSIPGTIEMITIRGSRSPT